MIRADDRELWRLEQFDAEPPLYADELDDAFPRSSTYREPRYRPIPFATVTIPERVRVLRDAFGRLINLITTCENGRPDLWWLDSARAEMRGQQPDVRAEYKAIERRALVWAQAVLDQHKVEPVGCVPASSPAGVRP